MDGFQQPRPRMDSYDLPPVTNPPPQFFGGNGTQASPTLANFDFNEGPDGLDQDGGHDENDPKRRRIARVRTVLTDSIHFGVDSWGRPATCAERRR